MAIKKQYILECEGPCHKSVTVLHIPDDWQRIKFTLASVPNDTKQELRVLLVCPDCAKRAKWVLSQSGFVVGPVSVSTAPVPKR